MAREFKEKAHLKTDSKKYFDNYIHVFSKELCECEECLGVTRMVTKEKLENVQNLQEVATE